MVISTLINNYTLIFKIILFIVVQIIFRYANERYKNKILINQDNDSLKNIPYIINIINIIISISIILSIFNVNLSSLYVFFGTGGAIILFSIQQIVRDFICGLLILFTTKPYSIRDVIELKDKKLIGTVKEINLFTTIINNHENIYVTISNSKMYDNLIYNYTKNETLVQFFQFGVNFNSNFVKIKEIIKQSIRQISIVIPNLTFESIVPCVSIKKFEESKATVEIRIVIKFEDRFNSQQLVYEAINFLINQNLIQIPYPKLDLKLNGTLD